MAGALPGPGHAEFGLVAAAQAVGGIVGGLFAASLSQRFSALRLFKLSSVMFGLVDLAIFLYPLGYVALWLAVAGMIVVGLPATLCNGRAEHAPAAQHAGCLPWPGLRRARHRRGGAAFGGTLAGGYLSRPLGIVPVIAVQGAGYVLAGLGMAVWARARKRSPIRTVVPVPAQEPNS